MEKGKKQAIVLIHGIGEQKPMETLKPFVEAIKDYLEKKDKNSKYIIRYKSDKSSANFETRVLRLNGSKNIDKSDFYECYWANYMTNNSFLDATKWLLNLMFSRFSSVPKSFRSIWSFLWLVTIIVALLILSFSQISKLNDLYKLLSSMTLLVILMKIISRIIKKYMTDYLGDAGRYFTPSPDNIESRYKIRKKGIALLEYLQKEYDRVIIIGHSLGGVIGYDLLRFLWADYHKIDENEVKTRDFNQPYMKLISKYDSKSINLANIDEYQQMQSKCLQEQINIGIKWRITDFITIGSPLCNIDYLASSNSKNFLDSVTEREFPICPPIHDERDGGIYYKCNLKIDEETLRTYRCLHRAALFAVTRWNNIYFKNDIIGGKMSRLFGNGVKDIEIEKTFKFWELGGHTKYWNPECEGKGIKRICEILQQPVLD